MELWKFSLLGQQGQVVQGCALCGWCVPTAFSQAAVKCSAQKMSLLFGLVGFRNVAGEGAVCTQAAALGWEWENVTITHAHQHLPGNRVMLLTVTLQSHQVLQLLTMSV